MTSVFHVGIIEHMFGTDDLGIELSEQEVLSGESDDQRDYQLTLDELNQPLVPSPLDLSSFPVGPHLATSLEHIDRTKLSGHDLVSLLQARERQISHLQAGSMADSVEISYSDSASSNHRTSEPFEFASDEIRAALTLTRRAADFRLSLASDVRERLPQAWEMLDSGSIDLSRARVFADGTAHIPDEVASSVVAQLADVAPSLTTGQLRARIRRLCITTDPDDAAKRQRTAHEERKLVIEPTVDGTANLHLFDIEIASARAIGRRINGHMISLKKEDRSGRNHDQLRADITVDMLLGAGGLGSGKANVDIKIDMSTLAGLDENPGEIPGMGPVIADIARKVADRQHKARWRVIVTDGEGNPVEIITTRRRPNAALSSQVDALQPTCTFPGCRTPASNCDLDHITPWSKGGRTSTSETGPKCRHDHGLKDHGWTHQRNAVGDVWTSPLGHTYITQGQSP